jgi:hypothetical protein
VKRVVSDGQRRQVQALLDYYRLRPREPASIWNELCRADAS